MANRRQEDRDRNGRNARLLERVLRDHGGRLLAHARFHAELPDDAEDALGDACVQFLSHFQGRTEEEARRWMLVVVKRCAWAPARQRDERREVIAEVSAERFETEPGGGLPDRRGLGPEQQVEAAEAARQFGAAMAALKVDERQTLVLIALGYSYSEIGRICGWTHSKVNRSVAEGRTRLRRLLQKRGERF